MLWIVRVGLLLAAAGLMVAAIDARQDLESERDETRAVSGVTGQRQGIVFDLDEDGRALVFHTTLYHHCSGGDEWETSWSPADGAPVPFEQRGVSLRVREAAERDYGDEGTGRGVATMVARVTRRGVEGRMRSVWRFRRQGEEYAVCDTGFVPFVAGPAARLRVGRMEPVAEPWSVYPEPLEYRPLISPTQRLFASHVDWVCLQTSNRRPAGGGFGAYVRWHADQLAALRRLGRPPEGWVSHGRWLANFERRVELERRELAALRRGDFGAAARMAVTIATLKAEGNLAGLGFGLRRCTSNGPTGAPKRPRRDGPPPIRRQPAPRVVA
jgi:hypothetical protein